jgi:uncharacterized protein HemX
MGFKLAGIMLIVMLVLGGAGYWYYKDSQDRIRILTENNAKLDTAVKLNEQTIDTMKKDFARVQNEIKQTNEEFGRIRAQNQVLAEKLEKHDLGQTAAAKPEAIQRVVNAASAKAGRCFELLSGAELTKTEKEAKDGKSFNSECPWLFDNLVKR